MSISQLDDRSDFGALAGVLRRRFWLVVVAAVVAVGAALFYSHEQQKKYQSNSVLLFRQVLLDVQLTGNPLQVLPTDQAEASATNVGLLSQDNVRVAAAAALGPPYTATSLKNAVSISPQSTSDLVAIQATADTPPEAARIANAMSTAYLQIANQQIVSEINAAEDRVRSQIGARRLTKLQRATLRAALIKLTVLASLGPQNVHLVQPAVAPTSPSSPKTIRNAVIGGIVGLVIGLALAFGVEQFDRRLRRPEEVERETGLPLLATVPRSRRLRRQPLAKQLHTQDTEPFRQLASRLRHRPGEREVRSVLITSSGPGSGKTTVALHLATAAAAGLGSHVFLLEADLRRPTLSTLLKLPADRGLSTLLQDGQREHPPIHILDLSSTDASGATQPSAGNTETTNETIRLSPITTEAASEITQDVDTDPAEDTSTWPWPSDISGTPLAGGAESSQATATANANGHVSAGGTLSLLLAGPRIDNATSLLESDSVRDLIHTSRERYDLTVIDGPPPRLVSDAVPLAKAVDAVIIVAWLGKDTGAGIRRLRVDLERLGIDPIGVVANYARRHKNPYYSSKRRR